MTTTTIRRSYDVDGELRTETETVVKQNSRTTTERSFDTDGTLRTETETTIDTTPEPAPKTWPTYTFLTEGRWPSR